MGAPTIQVTVKKFKLILAALLALVLGIIILQNTDPVETDILVWSFTMPEALLLFLVACAGAVVGTVATLWFRHRK